MFKNSIRYILLSIVFVTLFSCGGPTSKSIPSIYATGKNFPVYGGDKAGNRYSPLDQITKENVNRLEVAWMYDTRQSVTDTTKDNTRRPRLIECQPIVVDGILYGTTADLRLFALNAATGEEIWKFSPDDVGYINRGVMYWEDGGDKRIFYTVESNLYAVDAKTGKLKSSFGANGIVDLREGLDDGITNDVNKLRVRATSPGVIYNNTLVIGSAVSESGDAAPGSIRAFNVITGELEWVFHTIPHPGEEGYETWPPNAYQQHGGANNWSGMVLDEQEGVVFFGTGSPSGDYYGGNRDGKNLFSDCVVALNAEDGSLKWYFQTVHHDLWDRDIPQPPSLTTITKDGKKLKVVVQATKDGLVYVLDQESGVSVFPIEERAVPTNGLPGEHPWPTQKYPEKPLPFSRQMYTEDDISNISPEAEAYTRKIFERYRTDNKWAPPSLKGILSFGISGGAEWGGNAIDRDGILYQPSNDNPWILAMEKNPKLDQTKEKAFSGQELYAMNCASCHGSDKKGNGRDFPDISNVKDNYPQKDLASLLLNGGVRMPSFGHLTDIERNLIMDYLYREQTEPEVVRGAHSDLNSAVGESDKDIFGFEGVYDVKLRTKVYDEQGYPGIKPPWGTVSAIDISSGEYLWKVPVGEFPELTERGIPITGTEIYGGPIVTGSDLIFIAGTRDERIRALDKTTGKVVWEHQLPAAGFATPITYEVNDKQYIVIAAAGGTRGLKPGDNYIAFALPD
ncbi:outer membrane protein assembly factor BamB family protein [Pricia antarctica]|nr:PQQ-binding-like beta-propeller repeat protein [Pricia antarctica]